MRSSASGGGYIQVTANTCRAEIRATAFRSGPRRPESRHRGLNVDPVGAPSVGQLIQNRAQPLGEALGHLRREPLHIEPRDCFALEADHGHGVYVGECHIAHIPVDPTRPEAAAQRVAVEVERHTAERTEVGDAALLAGFPVAVSYTHLRAHETDSY